MRLLRRILRWSLIALALVAAIGGGGGYLWLRGALPQTAGSVRVAGISAPVEIIRDADAVPHIRAATAEDALFGQGYAHAQDRLWQMEFQRRIGNARLSEFGGPATLKTDTFLRTLGVARAAASAWDRLGPDARRPIEAYVAGVNAFIGSHAGRQLPIEFQLLGVTPEPWRPQDVLVWGKMMAWDLGGNWEHELLKAKLLAQIGPERTAELMPAYLDGGPLILPDGIMGDGGREMGVGETQAAPIPHLLSPISYPLSPIPQADGLLAINQTLKDAYGLGGTAIGSNNWVIGGARTTTGKPLLANDPHLGARIPSIWYLAHITGGGVDAIGATLPGVPGIVIGHNQRIAWGVTNTGPDVQDLYAERIDGRGRAEHNGAWEPLQIIPEVIKVKGQPDVTIQVRVSRHGPLISDVIEDAGQPLAFRWTALDPDDSTIAAFWGINRAQSWADFTAALRSYGAPMQNFVYADVDGNIGYYAPGRLPVRAGGDGTAPAPGWDNAHDWVGYVPFDELPHAYNPPQGYIATANNQVAPASYPHLISTDWAAPYRAERIAELIGAKPKLSPDDIAAMQADQRSAQARALLPALLQARTDDARARAALELIKGWDGTMSGDSPAAAIYAAWFFRLPEHMFADDLGSKLWEQYSDEKDYIAMALEVILRDPQSAWCDDARTPAPEDCADAAGAALVAGLADMAKAQGGDDMRAWRWDRAHHTLFPHNVLDGVGALKPIFSRSVPNGGDGFTVDVAPVSQSDPYNQTHVPSYREIIDLSDLDASRFMHTVGQSGQLLSRDYSNLIERWARVEYLPMRFTPAAVDAAAKDRLVLQP